MKVILLFLSVFAIGMISETGQEQDARGSGTVTTCSDGWRITGYYTPIETDFSSTDTREIEILGAGKQSFNFDFLQTVFNDDKGYGEGWGKTRFGWYLGKYDNRWHRADAPQDANDEPLQPNTVAVDPSIIPPGSTVCMPDLPGDLANLEFKSNDVGVSVHGKHVDVYTGEGREARRRMHWFTFEDDKDGNGLTRVCFTPPSPSTKAK